jgi:hypothetical protein
VKDEHGNLPSRRTGDVAIRDHCTPSPPRSRLHLIKPKREAKEWTSPLEYKVAALRIKVEEGPEEFSGQCRFLECRLLPEAKSLAAKKKKLHICIFVTVDVAITLYRKRTPCTLGWTHVHLPGG